MVSSLIGSDGKGLDIALSVRTYRTCGFMGERKKNFGLDWDVYFGNCLLDAHVEFLLR